MKGGGGKGREHGPGACAGKHVQPAPGSADIRRNEGALAYFAAERVKPGWYRVNSYAPASTVGAGAFDYIAAPEFERLPATNPMEVRQGGNPP